ncbi:NAD(P)-dependent oxidoreductase [Streptomyces meridianus]|uniref:D-isomer specific 2-hydroxyacid dehydrogenase NAD-binding domain-containing protein n=1 Tax=Streptomyces meridianus TaxID=2938945 RepID=A0ABT0X605_9ACTN|nr:NAD(P)-dependent oxidoreductase [Streptomyces meridianus]MCM2577353.1 hypothetical protein [Streptomyces meridianus]
MPCLDGHTAARAARTPVPRAPPVPETRNLLDTAERALPPDGGTVINTARAPIVDTEALIRECGTGRLNAWRE